MRNISHGWSSIFLMILVVVCGCGEASGSADDTGVEGRSLTTLEGDLLSQVNAERTASGLPTLVRDTTLDRIMLWYGQDMQTNHHVGHTDANSRGAQDRVRYYGGSTSVLCSEITQWRTDESGVEHYQGYQGDSDNQSTYMEIGDYSLGPTSIVGVVGISGKGPTGTEFSETDGSYSGILLCDTAVSLVIDPFSE